MGLGLLKVAKRWLPAELYRDLHHLRNYRAHKEAQLNLHDFVHNKCVFVHIPKAAGCSVGAALFEHGSGGHKTVRDYRRILGRKFWSFYKFTFVRNPYMRLVSAYDYLKKGGHPDYPRDRQFGSQVIGAYDDFSDFVLQWLQPGRSEWPMPHFYPQTHFIALDGQLAVDFIGRKETIEKDFATIADQLGKDAVLPKRNQTPGQRKPLASYYEKDAVIQRIQTVYTDDFERLGYPLELSV
jgi:hypothetical protein